MKKERSIEEIYEEGQKRKAQFNRKYKRQFIRMFYKKAIRELKKALYNGNTRVNVWAPLRMTDFGKKYLEEIAEIVGRFIRIKHPSVWYEVSYGDKPSLGSLPIRTVFLQLNYEN